MAEEALDTSNQIPLSVSYDVEIKRKKKR